NGIRADRFSERQAIAMKKSGCVQVGFGIESVDESVLEGIRKGETFREIERAVQIARQHFEKVAGFFVIGLPGSSLEADLRSLFWAREQGLRAYFSFLVSPEQTLRGKTFYGVSANPESCAYPMEDQLRVYREAKLLNRRHYEQDHLVWRILTATWQVRHQYSRRSWVNHLRHLLVRAAGFLRRAELQ
ncbi:MAG TPA: radical SAM protein, partial [Candidatus Ozemobacteraceae bacterium]|nr:radical SAM protein [Candidatus Ozemobacteraceae bacterium]